MMTQAAHGGAVSGSVRQYDFYANALLVALTGAAAGALDGLQAEAIRIAGWLLICCVALRCDFRGDGPRRWLPGLWCSASLGAASLSWVWDPNLRLASAALCLAALHGPDSKRARVPLVPWCWTIAVVACWFTAYTGLPHFHALNRDASRWISGRLGVLSGAPSDFGPLALGLPIWVTAVALWMALIPHRAERPRRWLLTGMAALPPLVVAHLLAARWLSLRWLGPYVGFEAPALQSGLLTLFVVGALLGLAIHRFAHVPSPMPRATKRTGWVGALAVSTALVVAFYPYSDSSKNLEGRVLIYDKGYLAWNVPNSQLFGRNATGMFGLLPDRLYYSGLSVERSSELTEKSLENVNVLFTINLLESLSPEQHGAVWNFVERGGTLVCLGDHTGLGGIREPFNELLAPIGIEYEFDSAKPVGGDWGTGLRGFPSRLTAGIRDGDSMPIGVGASLVVPLRARVLVSGVRSFADAGDPTQKEQGFLGDYSFNPGEPLSDLPLVACARQGRGRVLVFGDTSPFQNGAFSQGHLFLDNCMRWALGDDGFSQRRALASGVAACALLVAACTFLLGRRPWLAAASLACLPIAVHQPWTHAEPVRGSSEGTWTEALVDASHGQAFDLRWWQDDSIGGLLLGLYRNRVWPWLEQERFDLEGQDLLVMIAPTLPVSGTDVARIRSFVEQGGVVLCTAGYEAGLHSRRFLEEFGFVVGPTPLGPAESDALGGRVHFQCAYPIDTAPAGFRVLVEAYQRPVIGWHAVGEGAFVLVSDTRFLLNPNLENATAYVPENVVFLAALIEHLRAEERL